MILFMHKILRIIVFENISERKQFNKIFYHNTQTDSKIIVCRNTKHIMEINLMFYLLAFVLNG